MMRLIREFAPLLRAAFVLAAVSQTAWAADCNDVYPGAHATPSPDWPSNPYPGACYVDFPGGGGPTRSRYEQQCQDLPGYLYFKGDFGSNKNTCVFKKPSGEETRAEPVTPPPVREPVRPPPVRETAPSREPPKTAPSGRLVMNFDNKTDTTLWVKMFSQQRNNVWPAGSQYLTLAAGAHGSYPLSCNVGERVCYGAFDSSNRSWSLGRYGKGKCTDCCLTCAPSDKNVQNTWVLVRDGTKQPAGNSSAGVEPPPIDKVKTTAFKNSACSDDLPGSLYTTGPIQYSCRHTEIAHLQGRPVEFKKFIAIACGRSDTDMMARHNAGARAKEAVFKMEIDEADSMHANRSRNEIFITDKVELKCVRTR